MKKFNIKTDDLVIYGTIMEPSKKPKGVVQILHGMCEHKERYYDFMKYLSDNGYVAVIHDHRGHGESINDIYKLGYFGNDKDILTKDAYLVTKYIKDKYKDLDLYLFGHSMGSLVARRYISFHDDEIKKAVLCGTPTYNPLSSIGVILANIVSLFKGEYYISKLLYDLSLGSYSKGFDTKDGWLCSDKKIRDEYKKDKLCGFPFTVNGYKMLFKLMSNVYKKKEYKLNNKDLSIFLIGGSDDPVIINEDKFNHLKVFLENLGYKVSSKLYKGLRHELLNEVDKDKIYSDIIKFLR